MLEAATEQLATITGQHPNVRRARKSIANFKLREGMPVGVAVTLRGARMWEFLDRLITIAIPRIRDFRGLNPRAFDGRGNYSLGVREQLIFPEIDYDSIDEVRGLDIAITTTAQTDEEAFELLLGARDAVRRRRAAPAPPSPRSTPRRSAATRRPGRGPRPSRPRSSSSRRRTPRPTPSRSAPEEGEEGEDGEAEGGADEASSDERAPRSDQMAKTSQIVASRRKAKYKTRGYNRCRKLRPVRAPTTASSASAGSACAKQAHKGYVPGMSKSSW